MLPYEKTILVYGATGLRRTDIPKSNDFDGFALLLENIINNNIGDAMYNLGIFYEHGYLELGIVPDEDKATYWYWRAARENHLGGMYYYGNRLVAHSNAGEDKELQKKGFDYMKKAADGGFPRAQFMVGLAYKLGIVDEQDYQKALFYLRKASLAGETEADEIIQEINRILKT